MANAWMSTVLADASQKVEAPTGMTQVSTNLSRDPKSCLPLLQRTETSTVRFRSANESNPARMPDKWCRWCFIESGAL